MTMLLTISTFGRRLGHREVYTGMASRAELARADALPKPLEIVPAACLRLAVPQLPGRGRSNSTALTPAAHPSPKVGLSLGSRCEWLRVPIHWVTR